MRAFIFVSSLILAATSQVARAQVTIDVAKVTCEQFVQYKITDPDNIAIWISGYYNGKRDNTVLDTQALKTHMRQLRDFCLMNPNDPVLQAASKLLALSK
jgi:acid stress chaperone HdeB